MRPASLTWERAVRAQPIGTDLGWALVPDNGDPGLPALAIHKYLSAA